jgi:hypothetical protein
MRAARIGSRLPVGLGFLAVSGALLFRAAEYYSAPWAWLGLISGIFLALAVPWMVSAARPWNVWNLHVVAFLVALTAPAGIMVVAAMLASEHHAGDFTAHAVARTGTVTAVRANAPAGDAGSNPWASHAILALARPIAGQHTVVLRPPYDLGYAAGDRVAVLVDPRHLGDVELPGHQGWTTKGLVVGATGSAAAPVLLITGVLPPAAGVPLLAAAWLTGVIAMSATGRREPTRAATYVMGRAAAPCGPRAARRHHPRPKLRD